jgi:hypothetical protein
MSNEVFEMFRVRAISLSTLAGLALVATVSTSACTGGQKTAMAEVSSPLLQVTPAAWERLAGMNLLFGHQSVGENILEGIYDVMRDRPDIRLAIAEAAQVERSAGPGLVHFRAGENTRPVSKLEDFAKHVRTSPTGPDIAFLKFCYIDVDARTDVRALFEQYRNTMARLKAESPRTTFLHLTMPLRAVQAGWKVPIKRLIGRPVGGYADNVQRNQLNDLLRREYRGKEPLFDLAAVESTRPDGSRVGFTSDGHAYDALVPEYTYDVGHLNEVGRRRAAEALLAELAGVASKKAQ